MGIYVNNNRVYVVNGSHLNTTVTLPTGKDYTVVQEWDGCGGSTATPISLTVGQAQAGVTVSSPTAGSTVASPVKFVASATSACAQGVGAMGVYANNKLLYTVNGASLNTSLALPAGSDYVVVEEWDHCGGAATKPMTLQVGTGQLGVVVSSPANNSTVASPVSYVASATTSCANGVSAMGVYVDNVRVVVQNGASLNASVPMSSGFHNTVVQEWDGCGGSAVARVNVTAGQDTTTAAITASPASVNPGSSSVLTVTATNATQVTITGSDGTKYTLPGTGGNQSVSPAGTTTYTATATGSTGNATSSATVIVVGTGNAVLMHHNDLAGDGANLNEVNLTPANVNATNFGRKFALPVDGQIYAQPLYVPGLEVNGALHDTVFAATQNDSVYAFDADSGVQLWKVSLGTAIPNNDPEGVQPILGILSTPVIDPATNTMYVTAVTAGSGLRLHALDITTGAEKFGGPVVVTASVPGTGDGSSNGMVPLSRGCYQRTGLTLANGQVYLGFGHCNHGWLLAYSASTLAQTHVLNTSPDGIGATIWMGGASPVVDAQGNVYVITADDIGTTAPASNDFPDTFLKLSPTLQVLDSFTPSNERFLAANDADLGSGAPILLPDNTSSFPHEMIGGGKDGRVFVVNRDNLGGYHPDPNGQNDNIQTVQTGTQQFDNIWGSPALYWNGLIYYHTESDVLRAYSWSNGLISTQPVASGTTVYLNHGASPSISANGTSNGILWDIDDSGYPSGGGSGGTPAILHAHNASNVGQELYNSSQAPNGRDTAGHACKFSVPTVTDGKVFVPTCTELDIYGLLP
jgi:hypothetical protein